MINAKARTLIEVERARVIAYVPQVHVGTFAFAVETVVLMGRTAHGSLFARPSAHDRAVSARVLERFGISALPTASLDFGNQGKVMREIRALARSGLGVLFTTHDPNHALRAADRAFLLRSGERLAEGPIGEVLSRDRLEALYRAPVQQLFDQTASTVAFLPG